MAPTDWHVTTVRYPKSWHARVKERNLNVSNVVMEGLRRALGTTVSREQRIDELRKEMESLQEMQPDFEAISAKLVKVFKSREAQQHQLDGIPVEQSLERWYNAAHKSWNLTEPFQEILRAYQWWVKSGRPE